MAQLVEHILGKDEVPSSNLGSSSRKTPTVRSGLLVFLGLLLLQEQGFGVKRRSPVRIPRDGASSLFVSDERGYLRYERIPGLYLLRQKNPDRKIGAFGFSGAAIRFELLFRCIATESSSHIPTEDRQARLSGEGSVYVHRR